MDIYEKILGHMLKIALYTLHPKFGEILHSVQTAEIPDVLPADYVTNLVAETFNLQIWKVDDNNGNYTQARTRLRSRRTI
jgi:hypothetical protein